MGAPAYFWSGLIALVALALVLRSKALQRHARLNWLLEKIGLFAGLVMLALFVASMVFMALKGFPE